MEAIGREHIITRAFLRQVSMDIERNGLSGIVRLPTLERLAEGYSSVNHHIPLLVRSSVSRHSEMQPPLPGRLPLGNPKGTVSSYEIIDCGVVFGGEASGKGPETRPDFTSEAAAGNKRRRTEQAMPPPDLDGDQIQSRNPFWMQAPIVEPSELSSSQTTPQDSNSSGTTPSQNQSQNQPQQTFSTNTRDLPHRTNSPAAAAATAASSPLPTTQRGVNIGHGPLGNPGTGFFPTTDSGFYRTAGRESSTGTTLWDMASLCMFNQFTEGQPDPETGQDQDQDQDPWSLLGQAGNVDWEAIAAMGNGGGAPDGGSAAGGGGGGGGANGLE